jgi:hypothetical protein
MNHLNNECVEWGGQVQVTLDRETMLPPAGRVTLNAIRSYLETIALANQRVLAEFLVDGCLVDLSHPLTNLTFRRVDAHTAPLTDQPLVLLSTALQQAARARASVEAALTLVLINSPGTARELWWGIAGRLKEPVLTLSLMPDHLCQTWCGTSFDKLRRWQLEQIAVIIRRVDEACDSGDNIQISDALENLVLPWLDNLAEHIRLWQDATQAGSRLRTSV